MNANGNQTITKTDENNSSNNSGNNETTAQLTNSDAVNILMIFVLNLNLKFDLFSFSVKFIAIHSWAYYCRWSWL